MNVYFAGGEDIDFLLAGAAANVTAGSNFDAAYSRACINTNNGSTTWPLTNAASNPQTFGNQSSFWVHAGFIDASNINTTSGSIVFALADSSGVARLLVRGTGTAGQWKLSSRNAAATITDFSGASTASSAYAVSTFTKLDLFVNYAVSGQFSLYINGVLAADTGAGVDVTTNSATSLSYVYLSSPNTSHGVNLSQVIVADSDTRSACLWLMNSNTAGNAQTFSGTATNVNKATISDSTYITAASAGLINQYKTGGIALPGGTFTVPAVVMSSRALVGISGPSQVEYVTRVGSTDYTGGAWAPVVGTFGNNANYIQSTNPGTSSAWATGDLTASTFNYGVESVT